MIVFLPRSLDADHRCCGRKPIFYKTAHGLRQSKDAHHFCATCDSEFGLDGKQRANWAWAPVEGGFIPRNTAGACFKQEDWADFFAVEPGRRSRWRSDRQQEIHRRPA